MTKKMLKQIKAIWFFSGMICTWMVISLGGLLTTKTDGSFWTASVLFSSMMFIILALIDKIVIGRDNTMNM